MDKIAIWKTMEQFAYIDQINVADIPKNPSIISDLQQEYKGLTVELINEIIKDHEEKTEKGQEPESDSKDLPSNDQPKKPKNENDDVITEAISVYQSKSPNLINNLTTVPRNIEQLAEKANLPLTIIDALPIEFFDTFLKSAEKLITPAHLKMIGHTTSSTPDTPYLGCLIAKDLLSLMKNISVSVDTKFVPIPKLEDVLVVCTCTIRDSNRNVMVDGIMATQYLLKRRVLDVSDMETETSYGDKGTVEKCCTNAIRRAVEYMLPPFVMQELTKIAERKYNEINKVKAKESPDLPYKPLNRRR